VIPRTLPLAAALALAAPALADQAAPAGAAPPVLTLAEAVRLAAENQPQLRQARAATQVAAARADAARAPLLPQVGASGTYALSTRNTRAHGSSLSAPRSPTAVFTGSASQLVWDFGQTSGRWEAARAAATSQEASEQAALQQAVQGARSAFFAARAAKALVQVARESLQNQEAHLRQIEGFVRVGTRPAIDLAQARTDRANAQVQLIGAESGYATARAQLDLATGVERSGTYDVADDSLPPVEGEDAATEALLSGALAVRPETAALDQQRRAQQATLAAVRGGYLPSLGVLGQVKNDGGLPLHGAGWNWSASATLSWDLFQGGATRAQEREAAANLEGVEAQLTGLRQQIRLEVEQARLAILSAKATQGAAAEALANARERLRLAEGRYQAGAGSAIELGDSQVALTAAAAQAVQADYALASARAQLLRALGRP